MAADSPIHIPDYVVMFDPSPKNRCGTWPRSSSSAGARGGLTGPVHSCLSNHLP